MNLAAYFVQAVRRFPEAVAVVDEQVRWSYRDLYTEVTAVAAHLQQRGLAPGDHVLVVLKNRRENVVVYWACQLLGLIYTPVNFRLSPAELAYCAGDADPRLVIYEDDNRATVEAALAQAQCTAPAFGVGPGCGPETYQALRAHDCSLQPLPQVADEAPAIMLYTSGTTGRPKGVPRTQRNEASAA